jgi:hypothetical protein
MRVLLRLVRVYNRTAQRFNHEEEGFREDRGDALRNVCVVNRESLRNLKGVDGQT